MGIDSQLIFSDSPGWRGFIARSLNALAHRIAAYGTDQSSEQAPLDAIADERDRNESRYDVLQLLKCAMEAPTADQFLDFLEFVKRFRRLSIWNARMAYIQRPGAAALATEAEWAAHGRWVKSDAAPILILWPFGPTAVVYELADTLPPVDRATFNDPFAVEGCLPAGVLDVVSKNLSRQKHFQISISYPRLGHSLAGTAAAHGLSMLSGTFLDGLPDNTVSDQGEASTTSAADTKGAPRFQVRLNDRFSLEEKFVTLAHELGHIFCGHLGGCKATKETEDAEQGGWPDRRGLGRNEREIEAEAVAYLVASRAGVAARSAEYLRPYLKVVEPEALDIDLVVRAAARIDRLAKLSHGRMRFK